MGELEEKEPGQKLQYNWKNPALNSSFGASLPCPVTASDGADGYIEEEKGRERGCVHCLHIFTD